MSNIITAELEDLKTEILTCPDDDWEEGYNAGIRKGIKALESVANGVISVEDVKHVLKDMYLTVANTYSVSDLHHDSDKVSCVAAKCRQTALAKMEEYIPKQGNTAERK